MGNKLTYDESHKEVNGCLYKLCNKCSEWFPCTNVYFHVAKRNISDGLFPYCKKCNINKSKIRNETNHENYTQYMSKWNHNNKDKKSELNKSWYKQNKQYREEYTKNWRKSDVGKAKYSEYQTNRKENKNHTITKSEWNSCLNYFNNSCAYCGMTTEQHLKVFNQSLHKEHVYASGRNDLKNCVPSCKPCNSEKNLKSFNNWYNPKNLKYTRDNYMKIVEWIRYDSKKYIKRKKSKIKSTE